MGSNKKEEKVEKKERMEGEKKERMRGERTKTILFTKTEIKLDIWGIKHPDFKSAP